MKLFLIVWTCSAFFLNSPPAKADLFGGDLPLLAQMVVNTLQTLTELERQTTLFKEQMAGIKDRIHRLKTISEIVQPSSWDEWKNPEDAIKKLRQIYLNIPKEYRTDKSDSIEAELSRAMELVGKLSSGMKDSFLSGKELEAKGADSSPGVAQKLTASGVGTLVSLSAQSQVIESHIVSLLAQSLASGNEREVRTLMSAGEGYKSFSSELKATDAPFSSRALSVGGAR